MPTAEMARASRVPSQWERNLLGGAFRGCRPKLSPHLPKPDSVRYSLAYIIHTLIFFSYSTLLVRISAGEVRSRVRSHRARSVHGGGRPAIDARERGDSLNAGSGYSLVNGLLCIAPLWNPSFVLLFRDWLGSR